MAADRPFPPSPRRLGLARRSGLSAASPMLVGGVACGAALLAVVALAHAARERLGASIAAACSTEPTPDALDAGQAIDATLALALPIVGIAAIAAVIAHFAQTRALWLPRRRLEGAPALDAGPAARTRRAGQELVAGAVIGGVAVGWLWLVAPRLAALPHLPAAAAALIASALAALVIAWLALGALDALLRYAELGGALRMTAREKREDDRLAGADPRWRELRAEAGREPRVREAIAGSTVLLLGNDAAVAIAWDPARRPVPLRTATGRGARVTQLLGLARHHRLPVHREPLLVDALITGDGPVPEAHWPRLAEIVAAVRR
jgi:flagellar biosynthesis protein FlhB